MIRAKEACCSQLSKSDMLVWITIITDEMNHCLISLRRASSTITDTEDNAQPDDNDDDYDNDDDDDDD